MSDIVSCDKTEKACQAEPKCCSDEGGNLLCTYSAAAATVLHKS